MNEYESDLGERDITVEWSQNHIGGRSCINKCKNENIYNISI
jgi:hypothetical protein